jgi:N-acyl-D-aspartate/D-glutamate deacylase
MAYDLLIRNGIVIDGSGRPGVRADVAVHQGRIAEIGRIGGGARETIDADGLVVSPGFIDPHTHYDAQICWDRKMSCSPEHGVTSLVIGNCGVGVAPCRPEQREAAMRDLVSVEGMSYDVLKAGMTWDWESFPDYMRAVEQRGLAVNLGFLAPLTPFRFYVMGEASTERAATEDEAASIARLLGEAIEAGALGFSTTLFRQHIGFKGRPLACRLASREELALYCRTLRRLGKGVIEIAASQLPGVLSDEEFAMLEFLAEESGRPITWSAMIPMDDDPATAERTLERSAGLLARKVLPQTLSIICPLQFTLEDPFVFAPRAEWKQVFHRPVAEQIAILSDPSFRAAFRAGLATPDVLFRGDWNAVVAVEVANPALAYRLGRPISALAAEAGRDPVDLFLDMAIEDGLKTRFEVRQEHLEMRLANLVGDPRTLLGLGDGGAHVDMFCGASYSTHLLGAWVRERQALTLERAVQRMTSEPADFFGLTDRGRLAPGMMADIAIFDPATVGDARPTKAIRDLPGGGLRLVSEARGMEWVIVNGRILIERGRYRDELPGRVLRATKAPV